MPTTIMPVTCVCQINPWLKHGLVEGIAALMAPPTIRPDKLYRRVIDGVMEDIRSGRYRVGSRLPIERDLADAHGVSRTTAREALVALEMLGVVELRKGSGIFVIGEGQTAFDLADLDIGAFELIEARRMLEGEVAAMAAMYATPEHVEALEQLIEGMRDPDEPTAELSDRKFHLVIAQATGNGALLSAVTHLWDLRERAPLARKILHQARGLGLGSRIDEHLAVLNAIRAKDPDEARRAMRAHLERVIDHLLITTESEDIAAVKKRSSKLRERLDLIAR